MAELKAMLAPIFEPARRAAIEIATTKMVIISPAIVKRIRPIGHLVITLVCHSVLSL
jgi:hypothetical protein